MKKLMITFVFVLVSISSFAFADDDYVFRKVKWGMTMEDVIASEEGQTDSELIKNIQGFPVDRSYSLAAYSTEMFGVKAKIIYNFTKNKNELSLIEILVIDTCLKNTTPEGCLDGINSLLMSKYKTPSIHKGGKTLPLIKEENLSPKKSPHDSSDSIFMPPRRKHSTADIAKMNQEKMNELEQLSSKTSIWQLNDKVIISKLDKKNHLGIAINYFSPDEYTRRQNPPSYNSQKDLDNL